MQSVLLFLFIVVLYRETYLLLAPQQDWSTPKRYASTAIDLAPPFEGKNSSVLKECIETAKVKYVGYVNRNVTAYVTILRPWASRDIYVTVVADSLSDVDRAGTLIHECTHLVWCTVDLAYYGDSAYWTLSDDAHAKNADSFVEWFSPYVLEAARREPPAWRVRTSPTEPTIPATIPEQDSPLLRRTIV